MHTITVSTGRAFPADSSGSILDAANRHGVALEYSCRTGRCGVCKAPLSSGDTALLRPEESLSDDERLMGLILTCCRSATSDLHIDVEPLDRLTGFTIKTIPSRIVSLDRLATDIVRVILRTPPTSPMRFLPGQYIDVLAEGVRRSYSIANAPREDGLLELLIRRYEGGRLSAYWFDKAKPKDLLRIEGPFGTFFLRDEGPTNLTFLATGTGIAPVKAILEELAAAPERAARHRLRVYWGNRRAESFCLNLNELPIEVELSQLLSGAAPDWTGARGYVHQAAIVDGVDVADTVVYACGSSAMIGAARESLVALGLSPKRFYADAFVSSN